MFKFFKDKIKGAISKLSKKVDEEGTEEVIEKTVPEPQEKTKPILDKPVAKKVVKEKKPKKKDSEKGVKETSKRTPLEKTAKKKVADVEVKKETLKGKPELKTESKKIEKEVKKEIISEKKEDMIDPRMEEPLEDKQKNTTEDDVPETEDPKEKKGFFKRFTEKITTKKVSENLFEEIFWELEIALLENNVALQVIEKIKEDLKRELVDKPVARSKVQETIMNTLKKSIEELFVESTLDLLKKSDEKKPLVICMVGINGSGKTTTIAKLTKFFQDNGKSVVLAAADTFRAAAIDQLQIHADKLDVKLIKHDYGADAAAVAFDAINHAKSKDKDIVLIDTAGRLHSNHNLVAEMKKIVRIAKPDVNIFVGESITGNDCVEQAMKFDEAIGLHGVILSKADIDEKGGAAISVSYVTGKPILYLGVGQEYGDLVPFEPSDMMSKLFT
jgi:fused signal recognition particle receptor